MPRARRLGTHACLLAAVLASIAACSSGVPRATGRHVVLMSQPVVFVPANIDFTGKTDVTNALQSFIDNVDNGVIVRFHKSGRYRVDGTLFVTNKMSITFDGQNATIFANDTRLSSSGRSGGSPVGEGSSSATSS